VVLLAMVAIAGSATWYAARINREYKEVARSEKILRARVGRDAFRPPAQLDVSAERVDIFLAVRDSLYEERLDLEAAATTFARERERNRSGGPKAMWNLLGAGSDLAPVYADYWEARNRALAAHLMSPEEYTWLYRVLYHEWLGRDPEDGRDENAAAPGPAEMAPLVGELTPASRDLLAPRRLRLEATYSPLLNPVELIFSGPEE
jgi:hypothetical protein